MRSDPKERWLELCELASKEKDADKMIALVTEINRLLKEKEAVSIRDARAQAWQEQPSRRSVYPPNIDDISVLFSRDDDNDSTRL